MSVPHAPRILLVDDHVLIRDGLARTLKKVVPGAVCSGVGTAPAAIAAVTREEWSLVVLDLGLPGGDGELGTLRRLRALRAAMPILVLSMFPEEKLGVAAIEAGADGYLCKTANRALIGEAVSETLAGRGYRDAKLLRLLAGRRARAKAGVAVLSARELDVLLALARGESIKEIAGRLDVGVTTISTYRVRLMEKLALKTNADLMRYVVEHRLVR